MILVVSIFDGEKIASESIISITEYGDTWNSLVSTGIGKTIHFKLRFL
jgi:hypothetical protein